MKARGSRGARDSRGSGFSRGAGGSRGLYARVLLVQAITLLGLWLLQRGFGL